MKKSKIPYFIFFMLLIVCVVFAVYLFFFKKESYRIIKIYEFEGDGVITRESFDEIEPYANMVLESGDNVKLNTGVMTLKLDDDKYVNVEENTEFSIKATGTATNSKTTINLKSGAITNDIQNKLNGESTYEINAPNVTISVRGTNYRVGIYQDEKGVFYTRVSVFKGKVATKLVYSDGTVADKEIEIESGKEVTIYQDENTTDYDGDITDIDYSTLPGQASNDANEEVVQTATDGQEGAESDNAESDNTTSEELAPLELTSEELDNINVFAKYVSSTQAGAAESIEDMTIQMSDEVVIKTMGILANDYMGSNESYGQYVIPGTYDGGVLRVSKDDIDQYIADIFGYTGIEHYELGNVMAGADGYEIWEHQGYCDTTITINETLSQGDNIVIKGIANLNYSDIFDPMFMDAEFTFTVRRNSDSPFGFTYVDFVFGKVTMY